MNDGDYRQRLAWIEDGGDVDAANSLLADGYTIFGSIHVADGKTVLLLARGKPPPDEDDGSGEQWKRGLGDDDELN